MEEINILITSVGRRSYMVDYFKEALKGRGKVYVANSEMSVGVLSGDEYVITPTIYSNEYIPFLLAYCRERKVKILISLFDVDLPILARNKELFKENGIEIVVSNFDVINICNDKWKMNLFLNESGILTPKTYLGIKEVQTALKCGGVAFPIIIKPRFGMGSIAIYEAETLEELEVLTKKCLREVNNTYIRFESRGRGDTNIIFQEKCIGQEYGLDIINNLSGEYCVTSVKQKLEMRAGETYCAKTICNRDLESIGKELALKLKHCANLDVDVMESNNRFYILDMNARFGGGYPFSHVAGIDLPAAIIEWYKGNISLEPFRVERNVIGYKDIAIVKGMREGNVL